jgi:hypothetical protein
VEVDYGASASSYLRVALPLSVFSKPYVVSLTPTYALVFDAKACVSLSSLLLVTFFRETMAVQHIFNNFHWL